jgi:hypothetical protein
MRLGPIQFNFQCKFSFKVANVQTGRVRPKNARCNQILNIQQREKITAALQIVIQATSAHEQRGRDSKNSQTHAKITSFD